MDRAKSDCSTGGVRKMGCVNATSAAARHDYQCQGELLRRRRRFGVFREYVDGRTHVASDGAKLALRAPSRLPTSKASEASRNVYHETLLRALGVIELLGSQTPGKKFFGVMIDFV